MDFEAAKQKALKYIGISKKTEYEVTQKLIKLGYNQDIVDKVISYLLDIGYINDYEYVNAYIKQSKRLLNYSTFEIKQKLLQKGIKKDIIEEKLDILKESNYDRLLFDKLISGKCKNMDSLKQKQYLYRRGLSSDYIDE